MKRKTIIVTGIIAALIILGYILYSNVLQRKRDYMPSVGAPPAPFFLCEVDSDCIHILAAEESFSSDIKPFAFQDCINQNYKESDFKWYGYGKITEKTGKDLCECKQVEGLKMCALKEGLP
ncbi:hypothetical protein KKG51_04965 [Patescibacteria group bacterium]|nr:hypothetical protein [Patescibacteria group bacterium]MBU2578191.1 hypothetical protein [Patescibacteria group bacterium]